MRNEVQNSNSECVYLVKRDRKEKMERKTEKLHEERE